MIRVDRIIGIETEYALIDRQDAAADPDQLATDLLYAYAQAGAELGLPTTNHVPAKDSRDLLAGIGTRFDYSGETPRKDARGFEADNLAEEARTDEVHGAALTRAATKWVLRIRPFEQHYYRGSATHGANGARLYVDHTHPEYAAPEARGPMQAAIYDRAGDLAMLRAQRALNAAQNRACVVMKNNVDNKGAAWGAHESYELDRATDWQLVTDVLIPFLVVRQVMCASGRIGIGPAAETPGFQLFQRADYIEQEVSLYTTRERPIMNTRDEPHADPDTRRRLHVITADSSMTGVTMLLRFGPLAAVLSLIENHPDTARELAQRYRLADPVAAVRTISRDLTLAEPVALAAGGSATALEILRGYFDAVHEAAGSDVDAETEQILTLWRRALDALDEGITAASSLVEWAGKYALLAKLRAKFNCGWDDPRLAAADLQFSMLDPKTSFALKLEAAGAFEQVLDPQAVAKAEFTAPANTRAGGRAALLAAYPQAVWAASWTSLVVDIDRKHLLRVTLHDPYHPTAAEAQAAIDASNNVQEALEYLGVEIPDDPVVTGWDEGVYADGSNGLGEPNSPKEGNNG
ncbi:MAG: proteasome accessory factor PafA2 family protein [Bowdeniella nasicola]|nr:proteasome accessory factor PafA2 family protein [Bowdeniella nasicola]